MSTMAVEIDKKVVDKQVSAQIMGWQEWDFKGDWNGDDKATFFADVGDYRGVAVYANGAEDPSYYFSPATNPADVFQVEERIKELNLEEQYGDALAYIVMDSTMWSLGRVYERDIFSIAHASPLDRCRAALSAIQATKTPKARIPDR